MNLMQRIENLPEPVQLKVLEMKGLCAFCVNGKVDAECDSLATCKLDKLLHWYVPDCTNWNLAEGVTYISEGEIWKF